MREQVRGYEKRSHGRVIRVKSYERRKPPQDPASVGLRTQRRIMHRRRIK